MKKLVYILIPVIIIAVSVIVMIGGNYLKKPRGEEDNVLKFVDAIKSDLQNEKWESAVNNIKKAEAAYKIVRKRIQFSVERDEASRIEDNLARAKGFALSGNKSGALAELSELSNHWEQLGK